MKRIGLFIILFFVLSIFSSFISVASAATIPVDSLKEQADAAQDNLKTIPTNPEDVKNLIADKYLKQQWNELISQNKILGPIHNLFMSNQWFFIILFKENYAFSLTFFATFLLWISIVIMTYKLFRPYFELYKSAIFALLAGLIAAHTTIISWIVNSVFHVIYAKDTWWIRLIFWVIFALILFLIFYIDSLVAKVLRKAKIDTENAKLKQKVDDSEAFVKGVKEGQKIVDKHK